MIIRWGIIGCGDVTEVKSGPGFQKARGSGLQAVMRRSGGLAEDYATRHGVPAWFDDADRLIHCAEVDAVYVATPPGSHLEYALRVAEAGKPAYVEKPMARNHAECQQMIEAFRSRGVPLFVAYYRRALPRFRKAKEIVDSGILGILTGISVHVATPHHVEIDSAKPSWRLEAEHSGGGLFLDLASHTLDILDFLVGPLEDVRGDAARRASPGLVEDSVAMQFRTPSGALGTGQWNFSSAVRRDFIRLAGTEGELSLSTFGNEPVELRRGNEITGFDLPNPPHIQQPLIESVVNELRGEGTCPSHGSSAARTSEVMDRVLEGYYGGRGDAFWLRPGAWPGARDARR